MIEDQSKYEIIETLARNCKGEMGRTALMKFMFFLQTIRDIPLGYRFTLYSYGPFDSDVLSDLGEAELLGYVRSDVVEYPGGYGYKISSIESTSTSKLLRKFKSEIDWVIERFGEMSSAELELASTIVFADREEPQCSQNIEELVNRVRQVKPHFDEERIRGQVEDLLDQGLLCSIRK